MISVICPTYGRLSSLEEALESFLRQTYQDAELLIVNDFPGVELKFEHPRVRVINVAQRFASLGEKRNFCVQQAAGDIIVPLDDDDIILPGYFEHCLGKISKVAKLGYYCPFSTLIYNQQQHLLKMTAAQLPNLVVFRKSAWERAPFPAVSFDENGIFLRGLAAAGINGLLSGLSIRDMFYIVGWHPADRLDYHTQTMFRKNEAGFYQDIERQVTKQFKKSGVVELHPQWKLNYVALKQHFLETPAAVQAEEDRAKRLGQRGTRPAKQPDPLWNSVRTSWNRAATFVEAAKSRGLLATAVDAVVGTSAGRRVDKETFELRKASCFAEPCPKLSKINGRSYCSACGCGARKLALLDAEDGTCEYEGDYTKLHYPELSCPLGRPGFKPVAPNPAEAK